MSSYAIRDVKIVNQLEKLEKDMQYMKSRQFVGGKTLQTYIVQSRFYNSQTIYNFDGPPIGQGLYENLIVYTSTTQKNPYGSLTIEIFDMAGNPLEVTDTPSSGPAVRHLNFLPSNIPGDSKLRWDTDIANITGYNTTGTPFKVRFTVAATDLGSVEAIDFAYPNL